MHFTKLLLKVSFACLCNAGANTLWKMQFNKTPLSIKNISDAINTLFTLHIIGGIFLYIISMLIFFHLLSAYKLSEVVPLTCLTYIFSMFAAHFIFNEGLLRTQIVGTAIIVLGLFVFSR